LYASERTQSNDRSIFRNLEDSQMAYSIDLSGRVAFVTGASSGLGAQFARTLARAGAGVVLASRRMEKLKELRARIEGEGGDAHVVELDVTDHDSIKSAVAHAETEMGSIDILVNNSGVSTTQRIQDVTPRTTTSSSTPTSRALSLWRKRWASACWPARAARRRAASRVGASSTLPRWPG
jgi:NAD(P)-dependent dehydrogenase (short-subunit alcohol dehydrogenase family)